MQSALHLVGTRPATGAGVLTLGDGPEVRGPALALLLAISGRDVARADLDGSGLGLIGA